MHLILDKNGLQETANLPELDHHCGLVSESTIRMLHADYIADGVVCNVVFVAKKGDTNAKANR